MSTIELSYPFYKYYAVNKKNGCDEIIQGFNDYNECKFYCENNNLEMIDYSNLHINVKPLK